MGLTSVGCAESIRSNAHAPSFETSSRSVGVRICVGLVSAGICTKVCSDSTKILATATHLYLSCSLFLREPKAVPCQ